MNYNSIVSSAVSWVSLNKVAWFLVFFWVSLPVLVYLPDALRVSPYPPAAAIFAIALYDVLYFVLIVGLVALIQFCLEKKTSSVCKLSPDRLTGLARLVFLELLTVFVLSVNRYLRIMQLLLIIVSTIMYYFASSSSSQLVWSLFWTAFFFYLVFVVYNSARIFFASSVFFSRKIPPRQAIDEAANMTHGRLDRVIPAVVLCFVLALSIFLFLSTCLGAIASLILSYFLIDPVALSFGFKAAFAFSLAPALVAYHYSVAEVFSQLTSHRSASMSIKRLLARKVLTKKRFAAKPKAKKKMRR